MTTWTNSMNVDANYQPKSSCPTAVACPPPPKRRSSGNSCNITVLPEEIVVKILGNLSASDLLVCKRVSKRWHAIVVTEPVLARAFYCTSHPPGALPWSVETAKNYYSSMRQWLTDFGEQGRLAVTRLDQILASGGRYFPEQLFFAIANVMDETRVVYGHKTTIQHTGPVHSARFSPDKQHLVTASDDCTAKICSLIGGQWQEVQAIRYAHRVTRACFSPDSKYVITTAFDGSGEIWAFLGGKWQHRVRLANLHHDPFLRFSAGATHLVICTRPRDTMQLYHLVSGQWQPQASNYLVSGARFHPVDNHLLATFYWGTITIWRCADGQWQKEARLPTVGAPVLHIGFSPNGHRLLSQSWHPSIPNTDMIRIWKRVNQQWQRELTPLLPCSLVETQFNRQGDQLLLRLTRGFTQLWQFQDDIWQQIDLPTATPFALGYFSPDGSNLLIRRSIDQTTRVWRYVDSDKQWREEALLPNLELLETWTMCFNASGNHIVRTSVSSGTHKAYIWGRGAGQWLEKAVLPQGDQPRTIRFGALECYVLAAGYRGVNIWTLCAKEQGEQQKRQQ